MWELIDNLTIRKVIPITEIKEHKEVVVRTEIVFDYSIVNKYLRCTNEEDIRVRLELIEQKLKRPRSYRIMNMLSDMTSFFDSPLMNEDSLDITQFEEELVKLHQMFENLERKYDSEAVFNDYIKDIYEAVNNKNTGKMHK